MVTAIVIGMNPVAFANDEVVKKININTATVEELQELKGIGPKIAEKIIEYREENGNFEKIEDIQKVKGIGPKKFEKNQDVLTVE